MGEPIRIGVSGASGRMGSRLVDLARAADDLVLVAALDRPEHPKLGVDAGELAGIGPVGVLLTDRLGGRIDVLIDFSVAGAVAPRVRECRRHGTAMVIGTTGMGPDELHETEEASKEIPVFLAPNFSTGVFVLTALARRAAEALGEEYDAEVIDIHHHGKRDAPSGTAWALARALAEVRGVPEKKIRRGGIGDEIRPEGQIGVQGIRAGDVIGDHTVLLAGPGERLELVHRAHSRDAFARGALRAARFLHGKSPGWYGMKDMIRL